MNEEFELRNRLRDADPGENAPELNETLVAQAALKPRRALASFRTARLSMAVASLSIVGLALASASMLQPAANQPLFSLAGSAQSGAVGTQATQEMSAAEPGRVAADSMMVWPGFRYEYVAGDLSTNPGEGRVYQAQLKGDPQQILKRVGAFFGLEAEPELDEWSTPEYPSYSIQMENASVGIYFSGTGNWYYSNWNSDVYSCSSASSDDERAQGDEYCEPKPTPELIPAESDLIAQGSTLFRELGFAVDTSLAKAWRSEWGASVSFPNIQNGINTGMDYYVGWDARGNLNYVAGHSFELVDRGSFETVSPFEAVSRISDGRWYGSAPSSYYENLAVAYDSAAVSGLAREDVDEPGLPAEEPEIVFEEPEIKELIIDRSETVMLSVFDAAGNYWYVPGYLLYNQDGWFDSIISLVEGVIELPEPFDYEIMPAEVEPLG